MRYAPVASACAAPPAMMCGFVVTADTVMWSRLTPGQLVRLTVPLMISLPVGSGGSPPPGGRACAEDAAVVIAAVAARLATTRPAHRRRRPDSLVSMVFSLFRMSPGEAPG